MSNNNNQHEFVQEVMIELCGLTPEQCEHTANQRLIKMMGNLGPWELGTIKGMIRRARDDAYGRGYQDGVKAAAPTCSVFWAVRLQNGSEAIVEAADEAGAISEVLASGDGFITQTHIASVRPAGNPK